MKLITLLVVVVIFSLGITGITTPVYGLPVQGTYDYPIGTVNISATVPDSPSTVTAYQVVPGPNDIAYYSTPDLEKVRLNVTSEADAPQVAQNILNNYGGLPSDAVLTLSSTEYLIEMNGTTNQEIARYPVSTNVQYGRKINDVPVVGDGAYINMELGDNGELLYLNKVWRTVTPDGNLSVEPVSVAIDKLTNGEVLNPKKDLSDVNITKIRLGYFEKGMNQSEDYLEPAWLFKGTTDTGDPIQYYVYARHFANFTASQTNISTYQAVQFTDTSDTTPTKWYWDFGDGTNSTEQNPSHMYMTAGNFTVNLTAWNDLGSDTETKTDYIVVNFNKPLNANFNATPTVGSYPLDVQFTDLTDKTPNQWFWDFGDGTNSTEQNPLHTYQSGGNYTVNLTAWNTLGSDTVSQSNYIYVYPYPAPVAGFTTNYTSENIIVPLAVAFNDTSSGNITNWSWDFGDGMNSTQQNPVHTYPVAGKYTVSMTASNAGGSDTKTRNQYITITGPEPTPTPTLTIKPTETCTPRPTETRTIKPTATTTHEPPCESPHVTGIAGNSTIRLDWDVIPDSRLQGYKVVISKNNPNPKYPDDGYMYWITDLYQNYSVIDTRTSYNGGDFGGYLKPGQTYYFSITAVYTNAEVPGNAISLTVPESAKSMTELMDITPEFTILPQESEVVANDPTY
ncbi:PKD domain-containing protein [Methanoregula sp.]|jgi:PKD repeat protein|uniref:PKD domain-containing protein n=1 Tax=Methanoregula sp. TaxID=2052170 RepID=UPI003C20F7C6